MQYNIFVILGMNRFSQKDTNHKFNMTQYLDKYSNIYWDNNVRNDEVYASTPFYEVMKTMDDFVEKNYIKPENVNFVFSRGTFGRGTENFIKSKLVLLNDGIETTKNIVISKSFGVIDSLKAIRETSDVDIDLFIGIDGYAPIFSRAKVMDVYKKKQLHDDPNGKRSRLKVFHNIKHYHSIVQRKDKIKGLLFGDPRQDKSKVHNYIINATDIRLYPTYNHYADGSVRHLKVLHKDMEEICFITPCCFDSSKTKYLNVNDRIKKELITY